MRRTLPFFAMFALASPGFASSQNFDAVEIQTQQVSANVYMLIGQGGTIGVFVGDDGVFVIDDQFAPLTDKILAASAAITSEPVRFVFNTHWHGDHPGGNENLGKTGALIVAHENVRERLNMDQVLERIGREPASEPARPDVLVRDDEGPRPSEVLVASGVVPMPVRVEHEANGLGRNRPDGSQNLVGQRRELVVDDENAVLADEHTDVTALAEQHVHTR